MSKEDKYFIQDGMISKFDFMDNQEFYPLPTLCSLLNKQDEQYDNLAKKFVIVCKALELACDYLNDNQYFDSDCPRYSDCHEIENSKFWDCQDCDCSTLAIDYFTKKAKEMIESE